MTRCLLLALASLLAWPADATAQRTLTLERFDADIRVLVNGDIEVTETLQARFDGSWNGIFRNLSLEHRTAQGRRERLDVDLRSITDDANNALEVESSREGWTRQWKIWVPGATDATRTVVIRYVVHNALRFFDEGNVGPLDELYWNVTGNGWEIPITQASASITLPDGVMPSQSAGYTGPAGSRESAVDITTDGNTVRFVTTRPFAPGEGLTAAVGWAPGVVQRPEPPSPVVTALAQVFPIALPISVFALAFGAWRRTGRDPESRAIAVEYEPPAELTPTEVGTLVDHKADMRDITAALVDLAVRGFVHIEKKRERKLLGLVSSTDYVFHLKKPRHEWRGLYEHEQLYLDALFKGEYTTRSGGLLSLFTGADNEPPDMSGAGEGPTYDSVELSDLQNKFYRELPPIRQAIYTGLLNKGHYARNPEKVKTAWIVGGIALLIAGFAATAFVSDSGFLGLHPVTVAIAGFGSAIILLVFAQLMPARTERGARAREKALGFREFLKRVEEERFRRMITSPEMFEKYLPFALAFKVEERWAKAFEDLYAEPPRWYSGYGTGAFHASSFSRDMSALTTAASSTMASSPSSSGSGGGGSSGGGSGGGGGGGF
jgi:hypothetical protein